MTDIKQRLTRNIVYNSMGFFWTALVAFILFPIIVRYIGAEPAGLWFLLFAVIRYLYLFTFGIRPSVVKEVSSYTTRDQERAIHSTITTAIALLNVFGFLATAANASRLLGIWLYQETVI